MERGSGHDNYLMLNEVMSFIPLKIGLNAIFEGKKALLKKENNIGEGCQIPEAAASYKVLLEAEKNDIGPENTFS